MLKVGYDGAYEVRKCANDCLVSECMTRIGEISKLKYAPEKRKVRIFMPSMRSTHTWCTCGTVLSKHPLLVLALVALRQIAFKLRHTVLLCVDLNVSGYPFIELA